MHAQEPYWPYTTPTAKRRNAGNLARFIPRNAATWLALAICQEEDTLDDYHRAFAQWERSKPNPKDFVSTRERRRIERLEREWEAAADDELGRWRAKLRRAMD